MGGIYLGPVYTYRFHIFHTPRHGTGSGTDFCVNLQVQEAS